MCDLFENLAVKIDFIKNDQTWSELQRRPFDLGHDAEQLEKWDKYISFVGVRFQTAVLTAQSCRTTEGKY
jgi:hypothetical protein